MTLDELRSTMVRILKIAPETVTSDLKLNDVAEWDSLGHLQLMLYLETEKHLEIDADAIAKGTSVRGLMELLAGKGATQGAARPTRVE